MSLVLVTPVPEIRAEKITALFVISTGAVKLTNLTLAIGTPSASRAESPSRATIAKDKSGEMRSLRIAESFAVVVDGEPLPDEKFAITAIRPLLFTRGSP